MARARPLPGWLRVALNSVWQNATSENILWFQTTGYDAADGSDILSALDQVKDAWLAGPGTKLSSSLTLASGRGVLYQTADDIAADLEFGYAGAGPADVCPGQAAICTPYTIAAYYRGGKPRQYWGGVPAGELADARTLEASFATAFTSSMATMLTALNAITTTNLTTCSFGCASFVRGGVDRVTPVMYPMLAVTTQQRLCTQRRRLGASIA